MSSPSVQTRLHGLPSVFTAGRNRGAISLVGVAALIVHVMAGVLGDPLEKRLGKQQVGKQQLADSTVVPEVVSENQAAAIARDIVIGAYGGVTYTHRSVVAITKPGVTDMTVKDFNWIGLPFKAPIYYGLRVQRWQPVTGFGSMVDFTHAKAIAVASDEATFSGTRDGKPVEPKAQIGKVFRHLEFSHGHNMLTYNGLFRWPSLGRLSGPFRPYVGLGAGITLPHTEIGLADKNARTYEYQFAGFVAQLLGGVEINFGRTSTFAEYKFSFSPYEVPLSEEPRGFILFTDLWRQFKAWTSGEQPSGGRLSTNLATHHGNVGVLTRIGALPTLPAPR